MSTHCLLLSPPQRASHRIHTRRGGAEEEEEEGRGECAALSAPYIRFLEPLLEGRRLQGGGAGGGVNIILFTPLFPYGTTLPRFSAIR